MDVLTWTQIVAAVLCGNLASYLFIKAAIKSSKYPMSDQPFSVLVVLAAVPAFVALAAYFLTV